MHVFDVSLYLPRSLFLLLRTSGFRFITNLTEVSHELTELGLVRCSISEELVLKQLIGTPSLLRVLDQGLIDEVLEDFGPAFLERWRAALHDVHDDTVLRLADVGRIAVGQLHREDTIRPDVYFGIIASLTFD